MASKFRNSRLGGHFNIALTAVFLSMFITIFAFISEENKGSMATGFAVSSSNANADISQQSLREFNNIKSLGTLAAGNYYIDENGIVYWADDSSMPKVARVNFLEDSQKNRNIYIDNNGNIGYLIR